MIKKVVVVLPLLVMMVLVSPVFAQEEVEPDMPVVVETDPDETGFDLSQVVVLLVLAATSVFGIEIGYEKLIATPVVERFFKTLKPYQPFAVLAVSIGITLFIDRQLGINLLTDLLASVNVGDPLAGSGSIFIGGTATALLSMARHESKTANKPATGRPGGMTAGADG